MHGCARCRGGGAGGIETEAEINLSHDAGAARASTFIKYCFHLIRGCSDGIRLIRRVRLGSRTCSQPLVCTRLRLLLPPHPRKSHSAGLSLQGAAIRSASRGGGNLCLFAPPSPILHCITHGGARSEGECRSSARDKTRLSSGNQTGAQKRYLEKPSLPQSAPVM